MHLPSGCCTAFRLWALGKQRWFKFNGKLLDHFNTAILIGVFRGLTDTPPGWLKPPRKQLSLTELERRCTITWDVPEAALQQLLPAGCTDDSLQASVDKEGGQTSFNVHLDLEDYVHHGSIVCPARRGMGCRFAISRQVPGQVQMSEVTQVKAAVTYGGWGRPGLDSLLPSRP
jgi:hypothetical protein